MATASQSQTNGIPSQSQSQPTQNSTATIPNTQSTAQSSGSGATTAAAAPTSPTAHAPRPRDARTIELLLTSQGVTSFDSRVPLLLLDFAYRHTSGILNDAIHLSTDPYTTQAGSKPSGSSGAAPSAPLNSDAVVSTNAVNLAIASRQAFQFRGGGGVGAGGGASKDWLSELAKERNKVALPRVPNNDWGVRLPNERFVLSGMGWRLKDQGLDGMLDDDEDDDDDSEEEEDGDDGPRGDDAMEGLESTTQDKEGGGEGGGLADLMDDDLEGEDEDMEME